jgi:hypothetical protein
MAGRRQVEVVRSSISKRVRRVRCAPDVQRRGAEILMPPRVWVSCDVEGQRSRVLAGVAVRRLRSSYVME